MRLGTRLWFVGAWWLFPAMLALGLFGVSQLGIRSLSQPVSAAARVAESAPLLFAFASGCAALTSARLHASGRLTQPSVRSRLSILVAPMVTIVAVGLVATIATIVWAQSDAEAIGWPGWGVLLVVVAVLVATVAWGLALGRWLPAWIAAPLALVGTYIVLGFPAAMQPLWLRHLVGTGSCCAIDESLSPRVVVAATLVATGNAVAALMLTLSGPRNVRWPIRIGAGVSAAAVTLAVSLLGGSLLVQDFGSRPVALRTDQLDCRSIVPGGVRVCVWPEHRPLVSEYAPIIEAVAAIEREHGLRPTRLISEAREDLDRQSSYGLFEPVLDSAVEAASPDEQRIRNVSRAMAVMSQQCVSVTADFVDRSPEDYVATEVLERWWTEQLADRLQVRIDRSRLPQASDVLGPLSLQERSAWLQDITAARRTCQPSFLPPAP